MTRRPAIALLILTVCLAAGCNINTPNPRRTATPEIETIATRVPSVTPSPSPSATASPAPPEIGLATIARSPTAVSPSPAPTATPTSIYLEYLVNEGETLFYIIQLPAHGYGFEPNVAATVVALNDNIRNADDLRPGQTILIPRPTSPPTPVNAEATQALLAAIGVDNSSGAALQAGSSVGCHNVVANDSMVGIAVQYNTTLEILSDLNRNLNWSGCNFTQPSGGPDCGPALGIGQCVRVPFPTPPSTKIPTPTGDETATPTATKMAPRLLHPIAGGDARAATLSLQWLGLSGMGAEEVYLVELVDQTLKREHRAVTRSNAYRVPEELAPPAGSPHLFQWRVSAARQGADGHFFFVGAQGVWRGFTWERGENGSGN